MLAGRARSRLAASRLASARVHGLGPSAVARIARRLASLHGRRAVDDRARPIAHGVGTTTDPAHGRGRLDGGRGSSRLRFGVTLAGSPRRCSRARVSTGRADRPGSTGLRGVVPARPVRQPREAHPPRERLGRSRSPTVRPTAFFASWLRARHRRHVLAELGRAARAARRARLRRPPRVGGDVRQPHRADPHARHHARAHRRRRPLGRLVDAHRRARSRSSRTRRPATTTR